MAGPNSVGLITGLRRFEEGQVSILIKVNASWTRSATPMLLGENHTAAKSTLGIRTQLRDRALDGRDHATLRRCPRDMTRPATVVPGSTISARTRPGASGSFGSPPTASPRDPLRQRIEDSLPDGAAPWRRAAVNACEPPCWAAGHERLISPPRAT